MAVNFNDPDCGFNQREVVEFINKQIRKGGVKSHFYRVKGCHSWSDMEKKLRDVLNDSGISGATKEACAWRTLARAVSLAERQKREAKAKVKKLRGLLHEQNLFADVLVGTVNRLREAQARERERTQREQQKILELLQGAVEERNSLLRRLAAIQSAHYATQQGRASEEERRQAASMLPWPSQGGGSYWATAEGKSQGMWMRGNDGGVAGLAPAAPGAREERMAAQGAAGREGGYLSYSQAMVYRTQESPQLALNLTTPNYSLVPSFPLSNYAEVPPGTSREAGIPPSTKRVIKRKAGDWDCRTCFSMNFSWRTICFHCRNGRAGRQRESASAFFQC